MANVQSSSSSSSTDVIAKINGTGKSGATAATAAEDQQNRFLTLLVTQLKNQDPLNPMDNAQMTSQLAQINTVTGIEKLNTTMSALLESLSGTQAETAANLIGKSVMVPGSQLSLANGIAQGAVNLAGKADVLKISVVDAAGNVVKTENLGPHNGGVVDFAWDGQTESGAQAAAGHYTFMAEAAQGGNSVTVTALQLGTVYALVRSGNGFQLDLGSLGKVDFKNVQQIF